MTSLEIAELTGKQHKNLMRDIRNMEPAWVKIAGLKFELGSYEDANGQMRPCYFLTKTECLYIATKFNDEARARLVLRWQELELAEQARQTAEVLALEASTWVRILSYLRDSTTTLQLLATKSDFILTLMRQQLAAADPDADPNDIEVELALSLSEK